MVERLYTVPAGVPFLDALAAAIMSGGLPISSGAPPDPLDIPAWTLLLPTRRATRAMQDAFLRAARRRRSETSALLLPRVRPIAEALEDHSLLAELAAGGGGGGGVEERALPPAISQIERRLVLTRLVMAWAQSMRGGDEGGDAVAGVGIESPAQALRTAGELARLLDMVETEGGDLARLASLVPESYSAHWQHTIAFLEIVTRFWPQHLEEARRLSPADRRNRALALEARRIAADTAGGPVIVAGVTGSIPATVEVMRSVLARPDGALVLPGLDRELDEASWTAIRTGNGGQGHPEHPQFGLATLLHRLGVDRGDVRVLPGVPDDLHAARRQLVSEAMRPATTTDRWRAYAASADRAALSQALAGVTLVEAATESEEAEVVALVLREAVESPGQTAALVSPDRLLARRVAARLQGLGIAVDDSAGRPFAKTETGSLLDLCIAAIDGAFEPATVLSLLKHPLLRLGLGARERGFATRGLELAAFRTLYLGRGLAGIRAALERTRAGLAAGEERFPRAVRRLRQSDWTAIGDLVDRLEAAYAPLTVLYARVGAVPLGELLAAHAATATALGALPADQGGGDVWSGEDGEAGASLFAALAEAGSQGLSVAPHDYAEVYRGLFGQETVRPRAPSHPRVSIWGPLEARLQQADIVVLGSLNEGTWPEAADPGPWLNRPMRAALGLPSPEETLGHAAHDVAMLLGSPRVVLTRSLKVDNAPTVASRWLLRLEALLASLGLADALGSDTPWLGWARQREASAGRATPALPPQPRPPLALRPRRMSVSDVETWIANPYAIFARRILELEPLPGIGRVPDASLRGSILHSALARFAADHPTALPVDPAAALLAIVQRILAGYTGDPRVAAFWVPRFERFCAWFAATEAVRREGVSRTWTEIAGALPVPAAAGPFVLTARADRVDVGPDGYVIFDYKTGSLPSPRSVAGGSSPQLPLEAAIASASGLGTLPAGAVARLVYIRASGGNPPGEARDAAKGDVAALAERTLADLVALVRRYDNTETPYAALRRHGFRYDFDDFAHLARVDEWLAADRQSGGGAAGDAAAAEATGDEGE